MLSKTDPRKQVDDLLQINTDEDDVDKLLDKFYESVFDIVYDMRTNTDITTKQEITAILVRDLRMGIDEVFKENFD